MKIVLAIVALMALVAAVLHLARNRLLGLAMPRARRKLKERFGERADVVALWLDSRWRLRVEHLTLPLAGGVTIERASGWMPGLMRLVLAKFQGKTELLDVHGWLGWDGPAGRMESPTTFHGHVRVAPFSLEGQVWARVTLGAAPVSFVLKSELSLTAAEVNLKGLNAKVFSGDTETNPSRIEGNVVARRGPEPASFDVAVDLQAWNVTEPILSPLLATVLPGQKLRLPPGLVLDGSLKMHGPEPPEATVAAVTPLSKLSFRGGLDPEKGLADSKLTGHVSLSDLDALRHDGAEPVFRGTAPLQIDATLEGPIARPVLSGKAAIASLELTAGSSPHLLEELSADVKLEGRRVEWHHLTGSYSGGKVRGSGHADFAPSARSYGLQLHWLDVRVERIPAGNQAVGTFVRGAASGEMRLKGLMGRREKLSGQGVLTLTEPEYPSIRLAEAALGRYGLPLPPPKGTKPARCRLALAGSRVEVKSIEGYLDGVRFDGNLGFLLSGELGGRLELHVDGSYLAKSTLLVLPAALAGQVTVPVTVSGTIYAPEVQADVAGTLGGLLRNMTRL